LPPYRIAQSRQSHKGERIGLPERYEASADGSSCPVSRTNTSSSVGRVTERCRREICYW